jgi:hypothetical protein
MMMIISEEADEEEEEEKMEKTGEGAVFIKLILFEQSSLLSCNDMLSRRSLMSSESKICQKTTSNTW